MYTVSGQMGQAQGTSIPFNAITGSDTMMKNGVASPINTRHQCITCMKEYEQKSLEELRLEDYQLGRRGTAQQNTMFANTQAQPTGLFSSIAPASNTTNTFGQRTPTFGTTPQPQVGGEFIFCQIYFILR
jgi:nuclear pore complex protein Nup98-Nup96